jgi:hypothetical protein
MTLIYSSSVVRPAFKKWPLALCSRALTVSTHHSRKTIKALVGVFLIDQPISPDESLELGKKFLGLV